MDYMSNIYSTKHGNEYVFMFIDRFSKMKVLTPYKKSIIVEATAKIFFHLAWFHFRLPKNIISDHDSMFLSTF
jgi:hypothetical protein